MVFVPGSRWSPTGVKMLLQGLDEIGRTLLDGAADRGVRAAAGSTGEARMTRYRVVVLARRRHRSRSHRRGDAGLATVAGPLRVAGWSWYHYPVGAAAWRGTGSPLAGGRRSRGARQAMPCCWAQWAIPRLDQAAREARPEAGLLALRKRLGAFANLRPVRVRPALVGRLAAPRPSAARRRSADRA